METSATPLPNAQCRGAIVMKKNMPHAEEESIEENKLSRKASPTARASIT